MSEHEQEEQRPAEATEAPVEAAPDPSPEAQAPALPDVPTAEPLKLATPGMYWYDGESPTIHPTLGELKPGENDFSALTSTQALVALQAAVDGGLLEKVE